MIILLSPAKSLNQEPIDQDNHTIPKFKADAYSLSKVLKNYDSQGLQQLMKINEKLADENVYRFKKFRTKPTLENAKRAVNAFNGDVYRGLNAQDFSDEDYAFAQLHLRILSGMYGVLKPLDLIQPYRLEMGTSLPNERGNNLYKFWGKKPSLEINKALGESGSSLIVNLASDEYFKVLDKKILKGDILKLNFKEYRGGQLKFLSFNAKQARGKMARFLIQNRITNKEDIKTFNVDDYSFDSDHSDDKTWIFTR